MNVEWHKLVWFKQHIPRHAIITWLVCKNSLATKDRLFKWGMPAYVWSRIQQCYLLYGGVYGWSVGLALWVGFL